MTDRYVPELRSLCARAIANRCRQMTKEERYNYFRGMPKHLTVFIKAFPLHYVSWAFGQGLDTLERIRMFMQEGNGGLVNEQFECDCTYGTRNYQLVLRRCSNYYCNNTRFGRMILQSNNVKYRLCTACESYHFNLLKWSIFKQSIQSNYID